MATKTLEEIRREGIDALCERLGPAGMIRFLQQFDNGHGDYAKERRKWVESTTMEDLLGQLGLSVPDVKPRAKKRKTAATK